MLNKIQQFFNDVFQEQAVEEDKLNLDIACAVLLVEVMKADGLMDDNEQQHIKQILAGHFSLTDDEVSDIVTQAIELSENATDFHRFTSVLNQHYSPSQKVTMVETLWQLALADGELAAIEQHVIRKIADLLHLRHSEYTQAKLQAQAKLSKADNGSKS
ncbi:TerB family tellurite resistance protein [Thalassotalea euphylliae]|uniref:TerB family tellurite resistance protein n=1 Tax=Thalassotalea euphylliae TaxID=1655234 RepID=A0A3E0UIS6_9GAMM|nr:TerB family tellurite resistance protein [Thalassotalea euphylliae]REL36841.1 TerB family tellurite resistance protein [Thalassotalea euphylliae]